MSDTRELILLIESITESTTPKQLTERAKSEFATHFGAAALDNGLPAKVWDQIQKGYLGGYHHGYAAAVVDIASAAALKYADGAA